MIFIFVDIEVYDQEFRYCKFENKPWYSEQIDARQRKPVPPIPK